MNSRLPFGINTGLLILFFLTSSEVMASTPTMGVDELSRGMRGIGLTVFHGTKIDTFQVEILGVLRNAFGPKTDIILGMLSGDPLEKMGGIAGMSGSPVYVDGRLIGAIAYGWSFSIEPIMGITPIGEMLDILDRSDGSISDHSSGARFPDEIDLADHEDNDWATEFGVGQMQKVKTPVYLSGFTADVIPELQNHLSSFGLLPVQGGGGTDASLAEPTLEPGAALGVQLIRGDFNMTAIGTLTYIEGTRLVGFGHPMLSSGATRLPMTTAFIHDVVGSQYQSFKLGAAVKQVGVITQDRSPGVGGVVGQKAEMMPTTISVRSADGERRYAMEVLRNRDLGPLLIQSAVVSSLISAEWVRGEATVRTTLSLKIEGRPDFIVENVYAGARGLGEGVMGVTRPLQLLLQNPFENVTVQSAAFELEVAGNVEAARIESIGLDRSRFEPGDPVGVEIGLRPYLEDPQILSTSITIPQHFRQGTLTLRISSARVHAVQESKRIPGRYRVSDVDALIDVLEQEHRNDILIVELLANRAGATVGGVEMSSLPPSVVAAMKTARRSGSAQSVSKSVLAESLVETNYVLSGQQTVFLPVGSEGPALRFGPSRTDPTPKKK